MNRIHAVPVRILLDQLELHRRGQPPQAVDEVILVSTDEICWANIVAKECSSIGPNHGRMVSRSARTFSPGRSPVRIRPAARS